MQLPLRRLIEGSNRPANAGGWGERNLEERFAVLHGMPRGYEVYISIRMFAKSELWFLKSVICPPERLFAGLSNKTVNLEDHRQKH
jgi:hypothetical protein